MAGFKVKSVTKMPCLLVTLADETDKDQRVKISHPSVETSVAIEQQSRDETAFAGVHIEIPRGDDDPGVFRDVLNKERRTLTVKVGTDPNDLWLETVPLPELLSKIPAVLEFATKHNTVDNLSVVTFSLLDNKQKQSTSFADTESTAAPTSFKLSGDSDAYYETGPFSQVLKSERPFVCGMTLKEFASTRRFFAIVPSIHVGDILPAISKAKSRKIPAVPFNIPRRNM